MLDFELMTARPAGYATSIEPGTGTRHHDIGGSVGVHVGQAR